MSRSAVGRCGEELRTLAQIGALNGLADHRRHALWNVEKTERIEDLFSNCASDREQSVSPLQPMNRTERVEADYAGMRLTTGAHPMALLRPRLPDIWRASDLPRAPHGRMIRIAGNVICRQRPGTAKGFVFISLEDETGISNAIVTPALFEKSRLTITQESFLLIEGIVQNSENVIIIRAQKIQALDHDQLEASNSYDFH
jgi:error-prone DNA polymerase